MTASTQEGNGYRDEPWRARSPRRHRAEITARSRHAMNPMPQYADFAVER